MKLNLNLIFLVLIFSCGLPKAPKKTYQSDQITYPDFESFTSGLKLYDEKGEKSLKGAVLLMKEGLSSSDLQENIKTS